MEMGDILGQFIDSCLKNEILISTPNRCVENTLEDDWILHKKYDY